MNPEGKKIHCVAAPIPSEELDQQSFHILNDHSSHSPNENTFHQNTFQYVHPQSYTPQGMDRSNL
jgi:hypothetical protein